MSKGRAARGTQPRRPGAAKEAGLPWLGARAGAEGLIGGPGDGAEGLRDAQGHTTRLAKGGGLGGLAERGRGGALGLAEGGGGRAGAAKDGGGGGGRGAAAKEVRGAGLGLSKGGRGTAEGGRRCRLPEGGLATGSPEGGARGRAGAEG